MDLPLQLQDILPDGYSYKLKNWNILIQDGNNPIHFESLILTNIYTEEEAQQWWHEFNIKSNTTMRVRATCPKTGKVNIFKIYLRCLHQGRTEKTEKTSPDNLEKSKSLISRNTNCPADMIIAIRRVIKYSRSKLRDPVDPVHPCEIQLRFIHNHPINTADTLRFRPVSKEAEKKILALYKDGHSPCSALDVLKIDLQIEHGVLYSDILSDRYHCPDKSFCYRLYYKHFGKDYATFTMKDIHTSLIAKVSHYNNAFKETCVAVGKFESDYAIAACTPLMKKSHSLIQSSDMVYVESCECSVNKDNQVYHILLLYAHTAVGGVPLGTILVTNDNVDVLTVGFQLLKELLPDKAFGGNGAQGPHILLIKDSDNQKKALNSVWPASDVIVCIFRILQSMWEWLWCEKQNILSDHRLYLLYLLKTVLFASTESDMTTKYQVLCSDSIALQYPSYLHLLERLLQRCHLWALCFHKLLPLRDANNYYEAAVRAMKDKIFEQVKSFNFIQLLNYLVTRIDLYYESKFLRILQEKTEHIFLSYFPDSIPPHIVNNIKQIAGSYYVVPSENGDDKFYTIDAELNSCSCPNGLKGALCIHQHWLFLRMPPEMFKVNLSNVDFKEKLIVIVSKSLSPHIFVQLHATKDSLEYKPINKSAKNSKQNFSTETDNLNQLDSEISSEVVESDNELSLSCTETFSLEPSNGLENTISNQLPSKINVPSNSCINSVIPISAITVTNNSNNKDTSEQQEINAIKDISKDSELNLRKVRALKKFEEFCQRVKNGVENQTEGFLSALEIMLKNLQRKGNTDEQIISGLNFFGIVSAPSLESKAKKRPPLIHSPEEIIPLVYGREMITYGKKKCVKQVMSETQPTKGDQLPDTEVTKNSDGSTVNNGTAEFRNTKKSLESCKKKKIIVDGTLKNNFLLD